MKHSLEIHVAKHMPPGGIVSCQQLTLRERILRVILGPKRKLTILIPDDSVEELAISTTEDDIVDGGPPCETVRN